MKRLTQLLTTRSMSMISLARAAALVAFALLAVPAFADEAKAAAEKIELWPDQAPVGDGKFAKSNAAITVHLAEKGNGAAIVICPGGGYGGLVTGAEGHGIAQWLNQHGIAGIVLEYRLPGGNRHLPLLDAQRAIRIVRSKAETWKLDPAKIGIMGFSAGGHLASTAVTHFDAGQASSTDAIEKQSCRPDFGILVYPVITMGEKTHGGSRQNLLGASPSEEMITLYSNEKQVTGKTPPCFLTHALDDKVVPSDHSKMFADAMKAHKIPCEYLELPSGGHGLNGYKGPMWDAWQTASLKWLAGLKMVP